MFIIVFKVNDVCPSVTPTGVASPQDWLEVCLVMQTRGLVKDKEHFRNANFFCFIKTARISDWISVVLS